MRIRRVPADQIERRARTGAPQGVVAFAAPVPTADLDDLLADPGAFLVALDGVTDPQNLGAVMRTAETAGATGVVLADPPSGRAHARRWPRRRRVRSSTCRSRSSRAFPARSTGRSRAGVWCVGLDADGDQSLYDLSVADAPLVLVLGAEGRGLSRLARARCDVVASIPMHGHIESLNVERGRGGRVHRDRARRRRDIGTAQSVRWRFAGLAQLAEHFSCKEDVVGSNPTPGSRAIDDDSQRGNMRAAILTAYNEPLVIEEVTAPAIGPTRRAASTSTPAASATPT